jgi:hypothetical protein
MASVFPAIALAMLLPDAYAGLWATTDMVTLDRDQDAERHLCDEHQEAQQAERERLSTAWQEHGPVFP